MTILRSLLCVAFLLGSCEQSNEDSAPDASTVNAEREDHQARRNNDELPQWKLLPGQSLRYRAAIQYDVVSKSLMASSQVRLTMRVDFVWDIVDVDQDGTAFVQHKVERLRIDQRSENDVVSYDSDTDATIPEQLSQFDTMTERPMRLRVGGDGKIRVDGASGAGSSGPTDSQSYIALFPELPPGDVTASQGTWERTHDVSERMGFGGKMEMRTVFRYSGKVNRDGQDFVRVDFEIVLDDSLNSEASIKSQTGGGHYLFDDHVGRFEMYISDHTVDLSVSGQALPIQLSIHTKSELALVGATELNRDADPVDSPGKAQR